MRMFAVEQTQCVHRECVAQTNGGLPWLPEDYLKNRLPTTEEGSKAETRPALLFGLLTTVVIVLMVLVGISGKNVASHMAQQNVETTSSHVY